MLGWSCCLVLKLFPFANHPRPFQFNAKLYLPDIAGKCRVQSIFVIRVQIPGENKVNAQLGRNTGTDSPVELHIESHGQPYRTTTRTSIITSRASEYDAGMDVVDLTAPRRRRPRPNTDEQVHIFNQIDIQGNYQAISLQNTDEQRTYDQNSINQTWNLTLRCPASGTRSKESFISCGTSFPMESGTSTFYRHLCSEDDLPRSVSICPQRRCVAFGCSAGIELHWIDALTGQNLSRWFPLTAPSDYLYLYVLSLC
jgi:hypothetical protein